MSYARDFPRARERMVEEEVLAKGITDPRVIAAMRSVPRHRFLGAGMEAEAYEPPALPIGSGQTISAPHMVALMAEALALTGTEKILEVGTGSGYQAAVLASISPRVITLERIPELAERARRVLHELGFTGVVVKVGDGSVGYPGAAPYDRILVTAASPGAPPSLIRQLAPGGLLVAPVGDRREQMLMRYVRRGEGTEIREEALCRCVFVPLVGREGFGEDPH